ncbi:MAG TPA: PadR family transcriptional regulator [Thermomicrobiales bacterium]|nr:PadR family transcriptional regulator [Thermomicrobiales bacterium]
MKDPFHQELPSHFRSQGRLRGGPFGRKYPGHGPHRGGPHAGWRGDGRRARRGDVRFAVLQLIADEPANGYALITKIAERTNDRWRPSPGSIYPVLQMLVDEGLAEKEEGDQGRYTITDAGRQYLAGNREQADRVWDNGRGASESEESLRESLHKLMGATHEVSASGSDDQRARATALLDDVRKQIYGILSE